MISKAVIEKIDRTIKEIWIHNICTDYSNEYILKEASLKCCFYYHLRRKLAILLKEHNLRIYSEYYFPELKYSADIAIVEIDPAKEEKRLKNKVTEIVAIIEFKFDGGNSENTVSWIKSDVSKIKSYVQSGILCQYYFAVIYETECSRLNWFSKQSVNHWASGYVTELDAGYIDNEMWFEVHPYNGLNPDLSEEV